ncbi:unnamed protein product [Rotaria sp. Silwood1]|nr:unnamed protein product [Rotaria sp. Silwood1]CAF3517411.1 unnamed protein product [Rotaria sp. Silwood1]CAF3552943.1 unnamed protein product [Rotaria sp. Silwood1]CAF4538956.1 unnamed protein product [Rotaria sp. Silwood1]CAF4644028.1 unnamed protein product [Rotaria sp. Silwood1]
MECSKDSAKKDAKMSLREWRLQTRPGHRLVELKTMFEFNSAYPSNLCDLKLTPSYDFQEIISRGSINAYFDMICRDGLITAEIGEYLADNRVDLITCFVTLHHVPHLNSMLSEFVRILQPDGYLILREHDCRNERSLTAKYLNFVHAFMMIAQVGEFAEVAANHLSQKHNESVVVSESDTIDWEQQKSNIIKYTSSIQYRTRKEWQHELESVGFRLKATLDYKLQASANPQALYYAVYQLNAK